MENISSSSENINDKKEEIKKNRGKSRKGCMRGKGGPENALCKYKGVRQRTWGKWVAEIREANKGARIWLGSFKTSVEAARAYDVAAKRLFGPNAKINLPENNYFNVDETGKTGKTGKTGEKESYGYCSVLDEANIFRDVNGDYMILDTPSPSLLDDWN